MTKFTKSPWLHNNNSCDWSLYTASEDAIIGASYLGQVEVYNEADMDLLAVAPEMYSLLQGIEWSGRTRGQGFGFMSSGEGPIVQCCPCCGGIYPQDKWANDFVKSAHGHKSDCELNNVLKKARGEK